MYQHLHSRVVHWYTAWHSEFSLLLCFPFFFNLNLCLKGEIMPFYFPQINNKFFCKHLNIRSRKFDLGPLLYPPVYFSLEYFFIGIFFIESRLSLLAEERDWKNKWFVRVKVANRLTDKKEYIWSSWLGREGMAKEYQKEKQYSRGKFCIESTEKRMKKQHMIINTEENKDFVLVGEESVTEIKR